MGQQKHFFWSASVRGSWSVWNRQEPPQHEPAECLQIELLDRKAKGRDTHECSVRVHLKLDQLLSLLCCIRGESAFWAMENPGSATGRKFLQVVRNQPTGERPANWVITGSRDATERLPKVGPLKAPFAPIDAWHLQMLSLQVLKAYYPEIQDGALLQSFSQMGRQAGN